ncbi:NAD(P)/FAD-dependent oxidoreductase [Arcicella rosea]|uniref:Putative NAD/FAD-dependent oxidoreductase n=1 Tax=Arcicella rosea TaxID=502909 RepID=A0A841ERI0_9BACT|nr:FAD-dependent oxidoreductase [Arcicella rosea]MBB6003633.1 putative NAD/FAD-dependent oxidoreductase [Arcicella rosea]
MKILIVGAGMAGLSAARILAKYHEVTVIDKGRGVGGRMATRKIGDCQADHGTQYFSVQSANFQALIDQLLTESVVSTWQLAQRTNIRYFGSKGMKMIPKKMSENINVILNEKVCKIVNNKLLAESGNEYFFDQLIITQPVPQIQELLNQSSIDISAKDESVLNSVKYEPCIAVMAVLNKETSIQSGGIILENKPVAWIADNFQKGISTKPCVTLHASANFSAENFEGDLNEIAQKMLESVEEFIPKSSIETYQVHRWRYSLASSRFHETFYQFDDKSIFMAGDGFGIGNVEGAFLSGLNVAEFILEASLKTVK